MLFHCLPHLFLSYTRRISVRQQSTHHHSNNHDCFWLADTKMPCARTLFHPRLWPTPLSLEYFLILDTDVRRQWRRSTRFRTYTGTGLRVHFTQCYYDSNCGCEIFSFLGYGRQYLPTPLSFISLFRKQCMLFWWSQVKLCRIMISSLGCVEVKPDRMTWMILGRNSHVFLYCIRLYSCPKQHTLIWPSHNILKLYVP